MNGVKQGGVLSPVLFAVYTDVLLLRLQESGIGCHMGGHYAIIPVLSPMLMILH